MVRTLISGAPPAAAFRVHMRHRSDGISDLDRMKLLVPGAQLTAAVPLHTRHHPAGVCLLDRTMEVVQLLPATEETPGDDLLTPRGGAALVSLLCPALHSQLPAVLLHMRRRRDGIGVLGPTKEGVRGLPAVPLYMRCHRIGLGVLDRMKKGVQVIPASDDLLAARGVAPSW